MTKFSPETIARAKEVFLNSTMSLEQLARRSKELIGVQISLGILERASRDDPVDTWVRQRTAAPAVDITQEVETIRRILFQQIVMVSKSGLVLTGDFDHEEVTRALESVDGVHIEEFNPTTIDPQLVRAYMDILSKSKIDIKMQGTSAKTSRQQVLEIIQSEMANDAGFNS